MHIVPAVIFYVLFGGLSGCGKPPEDLILAKVGDSKITTKQLHYFEQHLPEALRTRDAGIEGRLDHLYTLVDKEILLQEAVRRGLANDPEMLQKLNIEREQLILRMLFNKEIAANVVVEESELRERFVESSRDRQVKVRKIEVKNREQAVEIARKLQEGGDFAELARRHSVHQPTAIRGGDIKGYARIDDMEPLLQEKVFFLKKGETSEVVDLPNGRYGIFQVIDQKEILFQQVRDVLEAELMQEKTTAAVATFISRVQDELDLEPDYEGLRQLVDRVGQSGIDFSEAERQTTLYRFAGGKITLGDFADVARNMKMGFSEEGQDQVLWFAKEVLLPRTLLLEAARRAKIDREEDILEWEDRRKQSLLLVAIRRAAVADIIVDPEEARRYYEQNPKSFVLMEMVTLEEILVKTEEEAISLRARIENGEDMGTLAQMYSLRHEGKKNKGKFHVHPFEQKRYGDLLEVIQGVEVDQLVGPIEMTVPTSQVFDPSAMAPEGKYYALIRLLESSLGMGPEPFSKVERRARALVRRQKEDRVFEQFLLDLRTQYEPRIKIYRENL